MSEKRKILLLCIGNTCRSQMAEGFARFYGKDRVEIRSAGTHAMGVVNRGSADAMAEKGIDITSQTSDQLTSDMITWADVVVTLGCCSTDELCPESYEGEKHDWPIDDPIGRPLEVMRRVRDDIETRIKELVGDDG
ncbi:MAG: arsenate reductase ArsC [Thermodesulfobacteriota bacterium]